MFARINTAGLIGMDGYPAEVEADIQNGLPGFYLTGAMSTETKEARSRVWNAIKNLGVRTGPWKIVVNVSPASIRKDGTAYDLPIAVAVLTALQLVPADMLKESAFFGEVGLDGSLKGVRGALSLSFTLKKMGIRRLIVPAANAKEAGLCPDLEVIGCETLADVMDLMRAGCSTDVIRRIETKISNRERNPITESGVETAPGRADELPDFADICGQEYLKRAAEIAVSGKHNFLMSGCAGSGKTMIAKRMPGLMPELSMEARIQLSQIYSLLGLLPESEPLITGRPFRCPHHSISDAAFAGGGAAILPGELSLASEGILFLDELTLFRRETLELLRQPMEERHITISRNRGSCTYPADFMLVAAMNPCPCGFYPDPKCTCTKGQINAYLGRLSRPLMERIDICAHARPIPIRDLLKQGERRGEHSEEIRKRVVKTHAIQQERFKGIPGLSFNSHMGIHEIEKFCVLGREEQEFLRDMERTKELSGRTYHKVLRVARTIADMEEANDIKVEHLAEAIELRNTEAMLYG